MYDHDKIWCATCNITFYAHTRLTRRLMDINDLMREAIYIHARQNPDHVIMHLYGFNQAEKKEIISWTPGVPDKHHNSLTVSSPVTATQSSDLNFESSIVALEDLNQQGLVQKKTVREDPPESHSDLLFKAMRKKK